MKLSARNKALLPGMVFLVICGIIIMRFGALMVILTVMPAIIAYFIDHRPKKPSFKVVAACNLSAALPFILNVVDLSLQKQYSEAAQVLSDVMVWGYIYCGAAAGWGMLYLSKVVARVITLMHYEYGIKVLEKKQELLVKEWGEDIIPQQAARKGRN
jgi:hypothetical protein